MGEESQLKKSALGGKFNSVHNINDENGLNFIISADKSPMKSFKNTIQKISEQEIKYIDEIQQLVNKNLEME